MVYGSITNVKFILGQTSAINDDKILRYETKAYNWINSMLVNIEAIIPIPAPVDPYIVNFEDDLTAGYFWKFESGDVQIAADLEKEFKESYMRNKYNRPKTITRTS